MRDIMLLWFGALCCLQHKLKKRRNRRGVQALCQATFLWHGLQAISFNTLLVGKLVTQFILHWILATEEPHNAVI